MDHAAKVPRLVHENGAVSDTSLEDAARMVAGFTTDLSCDGLDRVLAVAKAPGKESAAAASDLARTVTQHSGVLREEVRRFLALVSRP